MRGELGINAFLFVLCSLILVLTTASLGNALAAGEKEYMGVKLPKEAYPTDDPCRFKVSSGRTFQEVLNFFKTTYKDAKARQFAATTSSSVSAWHIESVNPATQWEGINIVRYSDKTEIYIIKRAEKRK